MESRVVIVSNFTLRKNMQTNVRVIFIETSIFYTWINDMYMGTRKWIGRILCVQQRMCVETRCSSPQNNCKRAFWEGEVNYWTNKLNKPAYADECPEERKRPITSLGEQSTDVPNINICLIDQNTAYRNQT